MSLSVNYIYSCQQCFKDIESDVILTCPDYLSYIYPCCSYRCEFRKIYSIISGLWRASPNCQAIETEINQKYYPLKLDVKQFIFETTKYLTKKGLINLPKELIDRGFSQ